MFNVLDFFLLKIKLIKTIEQYKIITSLIKQFFIELFSLSKS